MLGNGDGTFQPPVTYGAIGQIYSGNIVAVDFNSDGIGEIGIMFRGLFHWNDERLPLSAERRKTPPFRAEI
jgi:hypothetical protein